MKFAHFVILSVVLSISLSSAYGQVTSLVTVSTDKNHYSEGDIIYVSGTVDEILFGEEVNIMILEPNANMILINKIVVDSDKKFQTELNSVSGLMKSSGTYTVLAVYGSENSITKTTFSYESLNKTSNQDNSKKDILLNFDFINPDQKNILEHIDYTITVSKNGVDVFGPTPLTHSSIGKISIPMILSNEQSHDVFIEVHGILFKDFPTETFSFSIMPESENIQSQFSTKNSLKINLAIDKDPSNESKVIPEWLKTNAKWWADGLIDDDTFVQTTQYLINEKIVEISDMPFPSSWMDKSIPSWVKNNASWWADDLIPETEYIKGIKYLIEKGVIQV